MNYLSQNENPGSCGNIKIEYHDPTDTGRIVSQTFTCPPGRSATQMTQIMGQGFHQFSVKKEPSQFYTNQPEVVLLNGCWDTSNRIPNIIGEMRNVETENSNFAQFPHSFKSHNTVAYDIISDVTPSPRGSDSGIESDCTDGNLSWLLNYKIQELPPVPGNLKYSASSASVSTLEASVASLGNDQQNSNPKIITAFPCIPRPMQTTTAAAFIIPDEDQRNNMNHTKYMSGPKKPPFTYTELIEHALSEKGELTVSGIYQWISEHFPFYKQNDDRWKNSVRHNLSINPHFRKGGKAVTGAGHLWTIAQRDASKSWKMRQRIQQFIENNKGKYSEQQSTVNLEHRTTEQDAFDKELQAATESILGEIQTKEQAAEVQITSRGNEIHVEYINMPDGSDGLEDFLSPPVPKQQIVNECGLGSDDFFITDINPNTLGLNLGGVETVAEDVIYDEMSFEYLKE